MKDKRMGVGGSIFTALFHSKAAVPLCPIFHIDGRCTRVQTTLKQG